MTPIKDFLLFNNFVYVRDHADFVTLCAVAVDDNGADWLAMALAKCHGKKSRRIHAIPGMRLSDEQLIGSD